MVLMIAGVHLSTSLKYTLQTVLAPLILNRIRKYPFMDGTACLLMKKLICL